MTQAEQVITNIIREYQNRLVTHWRGHERALLIELVRSLDHVAFAFTLAPNHVDLVEQDAARHYMELGAATALSPLLKVLANQSGGVPWGPSNEEFAKVADGHLLNCGYMAHVRRVVELERYGLATTKFIRDNYLVVEVEADSAEVSDRELVSWLRDWENERYSPEVNALVAQKDDIARRLDEYISVSQGWFIAYDGDDEILAYHKALAKARSRMVPEAEALPDDVLLGRRTFHGWNEASMAAQSRVLHHVACAARLLATKPGLELRNLLTVFARKDDVAGVWQESGESSEWADRIVSLMTLDADSSVACESEHEIPLPFYIDFGRDFLLLPSFGALLNPCAGLVQRLKKEYRRDWDRGVDGRELVFRNDLRRVLPAPRFETPTRGFRLKRQDGNELTDVDAVILDRQTGSLALVQLKWHDIFGRSLRERNSRRLNLLNANKWVERVLGWVGGRSANEIAGALGVGAASKDRAPEVIVLARYAARFTGKDVFDRRAAWLGWPEFVHALKNSSYEDPLSSISQEFRGGGTPVEVSYRTSETYHLPGVLVEVRID